MSAAGFKDRLAAGETLLLDGGLATELEAQGEKLDEVLWSASLLTAKPDAIIGAHRAFLEAGAQCIATASYQASREGFAALGIGAAEADRLMLLSVTLAQRARDAVRPDALVAASLGPYGVKLHDGSEYTGNYGADRSAIREFHEARIRLLDDSSADVLALETVPSIDEAIVLAELLDNVSSPAWISFSCRDAEHICDGTPLVEAARVFADHPTVVAIGVNCTSPQFVTSLIGAIRRGAPHKAAIAYPNSGETYDPVAKTWSGTVVPGDCAKAARDWVAAGAAAIGGCCRMGPSHIAAMAAMISAAAG